MTGKEKALNLDTLGVPPGMAHPCSYLKEQLARERACRIESVPNGFYFLMMNHGWRRSGPLFYKPACDECMECRPIRVPIQQFRANRTQRKNLKRNGDLTIKTRIAEPTEEKFDLFVKYQKSRHEGTMCTEREEFENFLYKSPLNTREIEFRLDGKLIACTIVDIDARIMSAVYTWFDPDHDQRSPGTYAVLWMLEHGKKLGFQYLYLGYYIEPCRKMNYKTMFRPCEVLGKDDEWEVYK